MTTIGILSDTHITAPTADFNRNTARAFADCDIIVHAGDLTDMGILDAFRGKEIHAVSGNMCNSRTRADLPEMKTFVVDGFLFALCHGANGPRHNIEERLFDQYPEADCIIYGHTHNPLCHRVASTLYINPGSFKGTGRYGAPATYAIATTSATGITAKIFELPQS